ncbi:hypothetical protein PVAR5_5734 [Paecilomyces variotii No. 5]|uniref:Uncharacterized protein n=1 Tax=Byssochlamys spectabilis (strain No. 5 / NBRC 109023) TaxID=1356009 RepID=V5I2E8_BYSSN|nr:hypothetical protein PVAR5_5734 [Paecilomyces variotii No. 5]
MPRDNPKEHILPFWMMDGGAISRPKLTTSAPAMCNIQTPPRGDLARAKARMMPAHCGPGPQDGVMTALVRGVCSWTTVSSSLFLISNDRQSPRFFRAGCGCHEQGCQVPGLMGFQAPRYVDLLATSATWTARNLTMTPFTQ